MSQYYYNYPNGYRLPAYPNYAASPVANAFKTGAMIGATGATAINLYQWSKGQVEPQEAVKSVLRAGVTTGLAAGAAKAAGTLFKEQPVLSTLASFAAGTAVAYALTQPEEITKLIKTDAQEDA